MNLHWILQARVGKVVKHRKDDICVVAGADAAEHFGRNLHRLANLRPLVHNFVIVDGERTKKENLLHFYKNAYNSFKIVMVTVINLFAGEKETLLLKIS